MLLGCIGDDFTGSSDLANTLHKCGIRVTQYNGLPKAPAEKAVDAGVVALKTRTAPVAQAVEQSLDALRWLREQGCRQFLFKYCSTFDSTPDGNIGPVLDALSEALEVDGVVVCPAFPATGRSIYQGHLFVHDRLLSESGMEQHPLTPMTDPDIRRWLAHQSRYSVGHVALDEVMAGVDVIAAAVAKERKAGRRHIVVDAVRDDDLVAIGQALAGHALVSGGSGIAIGLPENFFRRGLAERHSGDWHGLDGPAVALCGSCSTASRGQIAFHENASQPVLAISAEQVLERVIDAGKAARWALDNQAGGTIPLIYSAADPDTVRRTQQSFGRERVAQAIEAFFAETARELVAAGVRRIVCAGGETSGAIVSGLDIAAFDIGPEIDPGVPALHVSGGDIVLALKSGNFGSEDFFLKAADMLAGTRKGEHP